MAKVLIIDDDAAVETMFCGGENEFIFAASDDAAIAVLSARDDLDIAIVAIDSDVVSGVGAIAGIQ